MAERSEAPRDAARRIVESVLAERGESVVPDGGDAVVPDRDESGPSLEPGASDPAPERGTDVVVAPPTSVEPVDGDSAATAAAEDPDDPRARARALVAEVLASRAALDAPAPPSSEPPAAPTAPETPAAPATPTASPARRHDDDPSRIRARELVAAALADAERRAAEIEAERAEAAAEQERQAAERARREAERERRIEAERRAAERRAAAERAVADGGRDEDGPEVPDGGAAPRSAPQGPPVAEEAPSSPQPDAGTTVPMSVAELAASVGADAAEASAEETHALPRHRDEGDGDDGRPALDRPAGGDAGTTVAIAARPHEPAPLTSDEPATREVPAAGEEPVARATPATTEAPVPEPVETYTAREAPAAELEAQRSDVMTPDGALEASVEVEPRPRQRRTGRWLLTSLLGAIALAVLFPLAVDALRALVAL